MVVSFGETVYHNPNYFSGLGTVSTPYNSSGELSSVSIFNRQYLEKRDAYRQAGESYAMGEAGRDAVMSEKINNLLQYIEESYEGKAIEEYHVILEEMSKQERNSQLSEPQLKALAKQMIEGQLNAKLKAENPDSPNVKLEDYIRDNMDTEFEAGLKVSLDGASYSQVDVLKEICNLDESDMLSTPKKVLGYAARIGAFALAGAGIYATVPYVAPLIAGCAAPVLGVGALIGGVVAIGSFLLSR